MPWLLILLLNFGEHWVVLPFPTHEACAAMADELVTEIHQDPDGSVTGVHAFEIECCRIAEGECRLGIVG